MAANYAVQSPNHTRRKQRADPAQMELVFRVADELRQENEAMRTENAALRADVTRLNAKLEETALIMKFCAESLHPFDASRPPHAS